jgi:selenide,water dikinase
VTDQIIKLTQYSHGAGCGCKISPQVLDQILQTDIKAPESKNLLVGNQSKDDAAVYDLGDGTALISTTDFFMPIVDDPYDFGRNGRKTFNGYCYTGMAR